MGEKDDMQKIMGIFEELSSKIKLENDQNFPMEDEHEGPINEEHFKRPVHEDGSFDDYPGSEELWNQALKLELEERLHITIQVASDDIAKAEIFLGDDICYDLIFDPFDDKLTYKVPNTPKQSYLFGNGWPSMLDLPRKKWSDLKPKWETLDIYQFNLREAFRTNDFERKSRKDLYSLAKQILKPVISN